MTKKIISKNSRALGIAPSSRGFGFAVLEGDNKLVDWGVKVVKKNKNRVSLEKVKELIDFYEPGIIVLEDYEAKSCRRSSRIRALGKSIVALVEKGHGRVTVFKREKVRHLFFAGKMGTKDSLAELLAARFPDELGSRLPPKRKPWMSADYRMDIFDAVALAMVPRLRRLW